MRIDWGYAIVGVSEGSGDGDRGRDGVRGGIRRRRQAACGRRYADAAGGVRRDADDGGGDGAGQGGGQAGAADGDAGVRRRVFDQLHGPEAAAVLGAEGNDGRRDAGGGVGRVCGDRETLHRVRRGTDGRHDADRRGQLRGDFALAYRQCQAANKLCADSAGSPMLFPKENFSNGCIATVDIIYPMAPQYLLLNPTLAKASIVPVLVYAASERWKFPFAPHDLGQYPHATGQVYGGGERTEENQMPVEESGNMLLVAAAVAKLDGNVEFLMPFWPQLQKWAEYLKAKGFDPENQLCTDDFAGHLAHNVNLSAKAIEGLGAWSMLCEMKGDKAQAKEYRTLAEEMAARWIKDADDGDHYRLTFDKAGTWSQKYNLVWDSVLGLNLFPKEVFAKEIAYYRTKLNPFGLPLDSRKAYTKLDWEIWTASMATKSEDFAAIVDPIVAFLNQVPQRNPMTDWYGTDNGRQVGFQARSVVGGVFMKALTEQALWKKWASRDKNRVKKWAPFPPQPVVKEIVATSRDKGLAWKFTTEKPADGWFEAEL